METEDDVIRGMQELRVLHEELRRRTEELKPLRTRKSELLTNVTNYLRENNQNRVEFDGVSISLPEAPPKRKARCVDDSHCHNSVKIPKKLTSSILSNHLSKVLEQKDVDDMLLAVLDEEKRSSEEKAKEKRATMRMLKSKVEASVFDDLF